jgi:hypothetical protein
VAKVVLAAVMRRTLPILVVLAALGLAPSAHARVVELGADVDPAARASCPESCQGLGFVSGYMGNSGKGSNPFTVRRDGKIVAFTVGLGKPDDNQVKFFQDLYGGPPSVRLSILRKGTTRKTRLTHRLLRQSPVIRVDHYFGSSPTFALDDPLKVSKGNIVALTVPTWAPAFAVGLPRTNWWRSSRSKGQCGNVSQRAAQQSVGGLRVYGCTYREGARLMYTATYIPDPRPTDEPRSRTGR